MAAYDDHNDNDMKYDQQQTTDRRAYRSKYKRRNQPRHQVAFQQVTVTEEEANQRIQELEEKNDQLLDGINQTLHETTEVATDTMEKLDGQRHQLIKVDKDLHEINERLDESKGILDGMKSWTGFIVKKFKRDKNPMPTPYEAPIAKKSAFVRNTKQRYLDKMKATGNRNNGAITNSEYETDNVQHQKLDEIHKGVKVLHEMANDMVQELEEQNEIIDAIDDKMEPTIQRVKKQNRIMKKICD